MKKKKDMYRLIIDTTKEKRQVIARIAKSYPNKNELIGKKVLALINLEPIELANYLSQAMLLVTNTKKNPKLIEVDKNIKVGTNIK